MTNAMHNGIIYVRVSSDEQVKGMSLDFQKQDCLAYALKKGIAVERVFEEKGESAKFADRPELISLLEYCGKHKRTVDTLIVWKLDRLSRNQLDYYYLKRTLLQFGIAIHSATEPSMEDSNSLAGKIFETFSALQAEIDNTVRSERTLRGMQAKIAAGIFPWKPPLGYQCQQAKKHGEKKTKPDEPDSALFPILQEALREFARGAYSQQGLARLLDSQGFASARQMKTRLQIVHRILYDYLHFYAGFLRNPWSGEIVPGAHRAMLTEDEYRRILAVRDGRTINRAPKNQRENPLFPLRRLAICAHCARFFTGSCSRGNGGLFAYYHCATPQCPAYGKSIRTRSMETEFASVANRYMLTEDFIDSLRESVEIVFNGILADSRRRIQIREKRLRELEERRRRIFEMREDGSYSKEEFAERRAAIDTEMGVIARELADEAPVPDISEVAARASRFVRNCGREWSGLPFHIQRRFQKLLFPEGIVYDRESGFQTAKVGPIFEAFRQFRASKSREVTLTGASWNHLVENLRQLEECFST